MDPLVSGGEPQKSPVANLWERKGTLVPLLGGLRGSEEAGGVGWAPEQDRSAPWRAAQL